MVLSEKPIAILRPSTTDETIDFLFEENKKKETIYTLGFRSLFFVFLWIVCLVYWASTTPTDFYFIYLISIVLFALFAYTVYFEILIAKLIWKETLARNQSMSHIEIYDDHFIISKYGSTKVKNKVKFSWVKSVKKKRLDYYVIQEKDLWFGWIIFMYRYWKTMVNKYPFLCIAADPKCVYKVILKKKHRFETDSEPIFVDEIILDLVDTEIFTKKIFDDPNLRVYKEQPFSIF